MVRRAVLKRWAVLTRGFLFILKSRFFLPRCPGGWMSFYLVTAQAHHAGGGCSEQGESSTIVLLAFSANSLRYKHFAWPAATGVLMGTVLVEPLLG